MPEPKSPLSDGEWMAIVFVANCIGIVTALANGAFFLLFLLPVATIIAGLVFIAQGRRRLGLKIILALLVLALIGFGTCALILSNMSFNGH